jgi:hypothetical protein
MQSKVRVLQVSYLVSLIACTAPWSGVVEYSPEPSHHSVTIELYRTVLTSLVQSLTDETRPESISVESFGYPVRLDPPTTCGGSVVPKHWADTLQHEVRLALSDPNCSELADSLDLVRAAQTLGVVLLSRDTTDWPMNLKRSLPPRVKLSRPGFNRDSTIAALRIDVWCGPLCGHGSTLLLARRPGKQWQVWDAIGHWIS